jgi:UDP-GlcNAc:undecaprenyl-phosphate GlcNAc-1-phosphate transferase
MSQALIPITALLISLIIIPIVRKISMASLLIAKPREDRWSKKPTPTLGGVGIFVAFVVTIIVYSIFDKSWDDIRLGIIISATGMFLLGLYDDIKHITPPAKLLGQILAASVVVFMGFTTAFFTHGCMAILLLKFQIFY